MRLDEKAWLPIIVSVSVLKLLSGGEVRALWRSVKLFHNKPIKPCLYSPSFMHWGYHGGIENGLIYLWKSCGRPPLWFWFLRLHKPRSQTTTDQLPWPPTRWRPWRGWSSTTLTLWWAKQRSCCSLPIGQTSGWMMVSATCCTGCLITCRLLEALCESCFLTSQAPPTPSSRQFYMGSWRGQEWWLHGPSSTSPTGITVCLRWWSTSGDGSLSIPLHTLHLWLHFQHRQLSPPEVLWRLSHCWMCVWGEWAGVQVSHRGLCGLMWMQLIVLKHQ